jgi:uncharacterized repeat protein (TIGR01451 family)
MNAWVLRVLSLLCLVSAWGLAHAADPVSNTLTARRIVVESGGTEAVESAATAKPGDVLEYAAEFRNQGASVAHGLRATLPLPPGTEFVAGSQHPAAALASLDGSTFAPLPLTRRVRAADGSSHDELVPVSEYRFLRWAGTDLEPAGEVRVSARVRLSAPDRTP